MMARFGFFRGLWLEMIAPRRWSFSLTMALGFVGARYGFYPMAALFFLVVHVEHRMKVWSIGTTKATAKHFADVMRARDEANVVPLEFPKPSKN